MQLDQVLGAGALLYMERYVNEGTRTYSLLAAYSEARQADRTLSTVTVPLDRGLELSVVLS